MSATIGLVGPSASHAAVDQRHRGDPAVGLAVGVDYALFYLRREREERARAAREEAALEAAAATSGRAVLISGLTVMVAMAGMFLAGDRRSPPSAIGTILVVGVAMLGSLTVLPALLS